jgi:hypothetical protein
MSLPSSVYVASLLASLHAAANIFTIACVPALAGIPIRIYNWRIQETIGLWGIKIFDYWNLKY